MKVNNTKMTDGRRATEVGFSFSPVSTAYRRQVRCLCPARPPLSVPDRAAQLCEPEREEEMRDPLTVKHSTREAIGFSLAIVFVVGVGGLFGCSLMELMKLVDRGVSSFMQAQLWIPR
jgi:hypothetical protein